MIEIVKGEEPVELKKIREKAEKQGFNPEDVRVFGQGLDYNNL